MKEQLRKKLHERLIILFSLSVVLAAGLSTTTHAEALYILTGTGDTAIVLDGSQEVPDLSGRMIYVASGRTGFDITLTRARSVVIHRQGETIRERAARKETFSHLLHRLDIVLSPLEMVAVDLSGQEIVLTIGEDITYYDKVDEPAPFETVRVANPEMKEGTEKVVQKGVDGVRTSIYEVVWTNGQLSSRQFVEKLASTAVDQIVEYGTAVPQPEKSSGGSVSGSVVAGSGGGIAKVVKNADGSGVLHLNSGPPLPFSSVKSMTATAYTAGHGGATSTTATGTFVQVGTVAVDKRVIPLGTRMYIVTNDGIVYGVGVAEDTGVRGNSIDLYYDTYQECIQFGRRSCTVYILK